MIARRLWDHSELGLRAGGVLTGARTGKSLCLLTAAALLLAACGVDGKPVRPEPEPERTTGVRVTGTAEFGVAGGNR